MRRSWLAILALIAAPAIATAQPHDPAMDAAVRDLCHRQVVMLGEASHGDGATFAFKAALIRRLVDECGFSAVLFESSHYDFVELMRRLREGQEATPAMLSSSIGGIWNRYAELTPLIHFLFARAQAGRLTLGGLDDQIGSAGAFFSLDEMPIRLTALLPADSRDRCRELIHRRIYSGHPIAPPASTEMQAGLLSCTGQMTVAAANRDDAHLAENMARTFDRDLVSEAIRNRRRDESMYRNLRWYAARLGPRARFIIWAQNAHVAYDASTSAAFPAVSAPMSIGIMAAVPSRLAFRLLAGRGAASFRAPTSRSRPHPRARWKRWRWQVPRRTKSIAAAPGSHGSAACWAGHSSIMRHRPPGRACSTAW
jgi:erythromycin esterase-like protein